MRHTEPGVAAAIRTMVAEASTAPAFNELLLQLMQGASRTLASSTWQTFVLEVCWALGGEREHAVWAAAAVQFAATSTLVVDDLVDDEWHEPTITRERALNASAALIWLAQCSTTRLAKTLGLERASRVGAILAQEYLAACAGEDLDLALESSIEVTEAQAHDMTWRKSGSLLAMACQVGAVVAVDDPALIECAGSFGRNVGMVAQLLNDLAGVDDQNPSRSSDLRRKKKTLPVVYTLLCANPAEHSALLTWYQEPGCRQMLGPEDEQELAASIRELGGLHYTWVVADIHRREALAIIEKLALASGRPQVRALRKLVPPLRQQPIG